MKKMITFCRFKDTIGTNIHTGAFLSIGLMTNFLSLKEIFLISLHGKPILGVILLTDRCLFVTRIKPFS